MRNSFASELTALAAKDERIFLLYGDIGNRLFDDYKALFPERLMNCGVAEANMVSMAAGMALCELRPVTYTIASFMTTRCLEQIRIDVCYQNLPVIIVGVGAGLSYALDGGTHHSCEDIAYMRILPNMTVVCPGDAWEVRLALKAALKQKGPVYIRLGKRGEPIVHQRAPDFIIGKGIIVHKGNDVCLLSTGNILPVVIKASEKLDKDGISAQVVSFHTVKPMDEVLLSEVFSKFTLVVTVEEHSVLGGFGSSVAEWLSDQPSQKAHLLRLGTADKFLYEAGEQNYARQHFGLTSESIATETLKRFGKFE